VNRGKKGMKRLILLLFSLCLLFGGTGSAAAGNTVQQTVSFEVQNINELEFVGTPSLVLSSISEGNIMKMEPDSEILSYHITFNNPVCIRARLLNSMQEYSELFVEMEAPPGGTSYGRKSLNDYASGFPYDFQTLVYTGDYGKAKNLKITFTLEAYVTVPPGSYTNRIEFYIGGI
jgi:hypothetical protein